MISGVQKERRKKGKNRENRQDGFQLRIVGVERAANFTCIIFLAAVFSFSVNSLALDYKGISHENLSSHFRTQLMLLMDNAHICISICMCTTIGGKNITIHIEKTDEAEVLELRPKSDPNFSHLFGEELNIVFSEINKEVLI